MCTQDIIKEIIYEISDKVCQEKSKKRKIKKEEKKDENRIDIKSIKEIPKYPKEFLDFCEKNEVKVPKFDSKRGNALSTMVNNKNKYWIREDCRNFVSKFSIETNDSIQLFNKFEQIGLKTCQEVGKNFIIYPYELSNKHKMRKNFKFNGSNEEKNKEINRIKNTIETDYVKVENDKWQLGHKNPGSTDNSSENLVLQPPIQAKYRDSYIFIDTLTKFPTPKKLLDLLKSKSFSITEQQFLEYRKIFNQDFNSLTPNLSKDMS